MMYAHIYNDFGRFRICYRKWTKFHDLEEEKELSPNIIATLEEPTGDDLLLLKKIYDYVEAEGIYIESLPPAKSIRNRCLAQLASLPDSDKIEMLETSVKNLAELLNTERRRLSEAVESIKQAREALNRSTDKSEQLLYTLQVQDAIDKIAEEELGCEHIEPARGLYWERRKQTDN